MTTRKIVPFNRKSRGMAGLGFDASALVPLAAKYLGSGGSTGSTSPQAQPTGSSSEAQTTTVSPTIQTAISPQISPVFQQAFQPSGSPMTAGTTQVMPTTQSSKYTPPGEAGSAAPFGSGLPSASGYDTPYNVPQNTSPIYSPFGEPSFLSKYGMYIAGGAAVIALAVFMAKKNKRGNYQALPYRGA